MSISPKEYSWYARAHLPTMNCAVLVRSKQSTQLVRRTPVYKEHREVSGQVQTPGLLPSTGKFFSSSNRGKAVGANPAQVLTFGIDQRLKRIKINLLII